MPIRIGGEELRFSPVGIRTSHDSDVAHVRPRQPAGPPRGRDGQELRSGAVPAPLEDALDAEALADELLAGDGVYYEQGTNIERLREGGGP